MRQHTAGQPRTILLLSAGIPNGLTDLPNTFAANFESAPVKPLALSEDGLTLYVVNTPGDSLSVIETTGETLVEVEEIPVGLEPVAVAVQPGAEPPIVWVANLLSDSVNVVDVAAGVVTDVIEVSDEPTNILFGEDGTTVFVVSQSGILTSIDAATRQVLDTIDLDCHTPRAAVSAGDEVVVAALHSGNNTTVAGQEVELEFADGRTIRTSTLAIVNALPLTQDLLLNSELGPWPTPPLEIQDPSPAVERIVPDAGSEDRGTWPEILALIDDGEGTPSDEAIEQLIDAAAGVGGDLENAEEVLQGVLDDVWDTLDHDLVFVDVSDPADLAVNAQVGGIGTTLTGMGIDPLTGRLFVSNLEARNLVRNENELRGHFVDHQIVIFDSAAPDDPIVTDLHSDIPNFNDVSAPNLPAQAGSLANPADIVFNDSGSRAYVAALSVDRVAVLDPTDAGVLGIVEVGRGPRGLAVASDRELLFTLDRTDLSVTMVDVSTDSPSVVATLALRNPEPASVRDGRNFLYSARVSNNFGSACAMCHIDGRRDHLSWDLSELDGELQSGPNLLRDPGEFAVNHPVKGPMFTQTFRGLVNHNPYHWRGDRPLLDDFNPTFDTLLGGQELTEDELGRFVAFLNSLRFPPNPFRFRDDSFVDERAADGEALFAATCDSCHMVSNDGAARIGGDSGDAGVSVRTSGPQTLLVRQLRGLYKKLDSDLYTGFGPMHSGRERREDTGHALIPVFREFPDSLPTDEIIDQAIAFVTAFHGDFAPVVGWQIAPRAPVSAEVRADLQMMIDLHAETPPQNDVAAHGTIDGERRTLLLTTGGDGSPVFADNAGSLDLDDLIVRIDAGDPIVVLATPPRAPAFADDFESLDLWVTDPDGTDTAETGEWEAGDPESTFSDDTDEEIQLGDTTSGNSALVTELDGESIGCCDVDEGVTSARSPAVALPVGVGIRLRLNYNFAHTENVDEDDFFRITVEGETADLVVVEIFGLDDEERAGQWVALDADLSQFAGETISLLVEANDSPDDGSIVEAAIDDVSIDLETLPGGNLAPILTDPGAQSGLLGTDVTLALSAVDPDGDPLTYSATGLPTGLTIDDSTGVISGALGETGSFSVEAAVTDGDLEDRVNFIWTVTDGAIFEDDFESDRGWTTDPDGTDDANTGEWEVGDPTETTDGGEPIQLGDATSGTEALVTDPTGPDLGCCDVDGGITSVRSPEIALPAGLALSLSLNYTFAHNDDSSSDDFFRVTVEGENTDLEVLELHGDDVRRPGVWISLHADISSFAGETVTLLIEAFDDEENAIIEAAIDDVLISESPIFFDDFESSQGWITDPDDTDQADTGEWERGNPGETTDDGEPIQLGDTTSGTQALVTDPSGGDTGCCDVDDGVTSVRSPPIDLSNDGAALTLSFNYNFAHTDNVDEDDFFRVTVEGESRDEIALEIFGLDEEPRPGQWRSFTFDATSFAGETITLLIEASDSDNDGSIVEAAVDDVFID